MPTVQGLGVNAASPHTTVGGIEITALTMPFILAQGTANYEENLRALYAYRSCTKNQVS